MQGDGRDELGNPFQSAIQSAATATFACLDALRLHGDLLKTIYARRAGVDLPASSGATRTHDLEVADQILRVEARTFDGDDESLARAVVRAWIVKLGRALDLLETL